MSFRKVVQCFLWFKVHASMLGNKLSVRKGFSSWKFSKGEISHCAEAEPMAKVKGALDPEQADILSAYSTEQGTYQ